MVKIAFCDDDISVLNELRVLLDRYRVERNLVIDYVSFNSALNLLPESERGTGGFGSTGISEGAVPREEMGR